MLIKGRESIERVRLLISLTKISNEDLVAAIHLHLCIGMNQSVSADIYDVNRATLNMAIKRLNKVNDIVESIKEIDWSSKNGK